MSRPDLPPLEKVAPAKAWQPFAPDEKNPWSTKWAGHLLRRAGFGTNLAQLRQAVKDGLPTTLDKLFSEDEKARQMTDFCESMGKTTAGGQRPNDLRGWWIYTMLNTL